MKVSRYVRSIKVVLILTMILLSPIKGLADGRKDEKIDRIEKLSKKLSSSKLDSVIEYIENLDMSKKKEGVSASKTQSRDTAKQGKSNNSDNSKKTVKSVSNEGRNNSQSKSLLDYTGYVILGLLFILLVICSYLLFVVNKLLKGQFSAEKKDLSAFNEKLWDRVNPQPKTGDVSENKNKERPSVEKSSLSAKEQPGWKDLKNKSEYLESENSSLKEINSSLKEINSSLEEKISSLEEKISSLEKEIKKLKSQPKAETTSESPQETESPSREANQDKVETLETRVYYIEGTPSTTEGIKLHTEKPNKSCFKVTVHGTSATLSVIEGNLSSVLSQNSEFVSIEQGYYGSTGAELISEGKGTIKYTAGEPTFTLTDKIKYKKV